MDPIPLLKKHLPSLERVVLGLVLGAVPVLSGFVAGWWGSLPFLPEAEIWRWALLGLLLGLLVDALWLLKFLRRAYDLVPLFWMTLYGFYTVGLFGMFMGFPLPNVFLAIPAGVFVGRWLAKRGADEALVKRVSLRTALFTTAIMALVCAASATLALRSPSTASEIQHMFGLPFSVSHLGLICVIVVGGCALLLLEWRLTRACIEQSRRMSLSLGL